MRCGFPVPYRSGLNSSVAGALAVVDAATLDEVPEIEGAGGAPAAGADVACEPLLYSLLKGGCCDGIHALPQWISNALLKELLNSSVRFIHQVQRLRQVLGDLDVRVKIQDE